MRSPGGTTTIKCLTYNIHSGVGADKRLDLERIHRVLDEERPDIAALQEVDCAAWPEAHAGASGGPALRSFACATRQAEQSAFGIAVLSRFPVVQQRIYDLSYRSHLEPRHCLRVDLEARPGAVLHVFNCHLGLSTRERQFQQKRMLSDAVLLSEDLHHPVLLMGDFNDSPLSVVHRRLRRYFRDAFAAAGKRWGPTFRLGPFPLRLDRIYCGGDIRVRDCWVRRDPLARVASDHLPVIACVEVTWP